MRVVVHQFDGVSTLEALPLAAGLLVASARRHLPEASFEILRARVDPAAVVDGYHDPDVLAFSTYVWSERYSLEVARRARARHPGAFVVFGGPSVPRHPERAKAFLAEHPFIDALAFGEGESSFPEILLALRDGTPLADVAGLALRGDIITAPRERIVDFSAAASPYLDGTFDALLGAQPPGAALLETNRGCPFACTFCDWGQAIASKVNELPLERLHEELSWIARRQIPYIYIVDANFGIRRRDLEIVRAIGRIKAATGFPRYVFFHLVKNATERHLDVVFALREAGIATHLALSAQDFEPSVLVAVKRDNILLQRALDLRRLCHERGIPTFNEMILGLPEQTYASFASSMVKAVTPYPGDAFQLYLARALPNAEMASPEERARYGLQTRRVRIGSFHRDDAADAWVPELEEIVVGTSAMPLPDWRRAFKLGFFLAAAHNLKLLDLVLQVAWRGCGMALEDLLEKLMARMSRAEPETALGRVDAVLERYAAAILAGEAMVLPAAETGAHLWPVEDGVAVAVLAEGPRFFREVERFVREELDAPLLEDAVRFQRFITPAYGDSARRTESFAHDFVAWRALGPSAGEVAESTRARAWVPMASLGATRDLRAFVIAYLGLVHGRVATGFVT
jgi:radical SAM superfamily enzyme YgiQ (UPF0313 family)